MFRIAKWITAGKDFKETLPSFQKHFSSKGEIKKATAYITAYGVTIFSLTEKSGQLSDGARLDSVP